MKQPDNCLKPVLWAVFFVAGFLISAAIFGEPGLSYYMGFVLIAGGGLLFWKHN